MQLRFEEVRNESTQGAMTNTKATSIYLAHAVSAEVKKKLSRAGTPAKQSNTRRGLTASIISGSIIKRYHRDR